MTCLEEGHKPGIWMTEGAIQVRRCERCNLIVVTADIPKPQKEENMFGNPKERP